VRAHATLRTAATAFLFLALWKEPEEDQAVAASCRADTPNDQHEQRATRHAPRRG
jgi:hypothetical protein